MSNVLYIRSCFLFLIVVVLSTSTFAQSQSKEKPTLKDFGSSLKKLKWDPEKKQAVINKQGSHDGTDDDVIRTKTSPETSAFLSTIVRDDPSAISPQLTSKLARMV